MQALTSLPTQTYNQTATRQAPTKPWLQDFWLWILLIGPLTAPLFAWTNWPILNRSPTPSTFSVLLSAPSFPNISSCWTIPCPSASHVGPPSSVSGQSDSSTGVRVKVWEAFQPSTSLLPGSDGPPLRQVSNSRSSRLASSPGRSTSSHGTLVSGPAHASSCRSQVTWEAWLPALSYSRRLQPCVLPWPPGVLFATQSNQCQPR